MLKSINTANTEKGKKILTTPCIQILSVTDKDKALIQNMVDTATALKYCIGLCANQIWEDDATPAPAIFIVPGQGGWVVCVNPAIDREWKKEIHAPEGCMSLPGFAAKKSRKRHLLVSFYSESLELRTDIPLFDIAARIFQHEMDHINGKLLNDE